MKPPPPRFIIRALWLGVILACTTFDARLIAQSRDISITVQIDAVYGALDLNSVGFQVAASAFVNDRASFGEILSFEFKRPANGGNVGNYTRYTSGDFAYHEDRYATKASIPSGIYTLSVVGSIAGTVTYEINLNPNLLPSGTADLGEVVPKVTHEISRHASSGYFQVNIWPYIYYADTTQFQLYGSGSTAVHEDFRSGLDALFVPLWHLSPGKPSRLSFGYQIYDSPLAYDPFDRRVPVVAYTTSFQVRFVAPAEPKIEIQPGSQTVEEGAPGYLAVLASGSPAVAYQWYRDGNEVPGATQSSLAFPSAALSDAGNYSVRVSNPLGTVTSSVVKFEVVPGVNTAPRLAAVSTRSVASTGENTLIAGFVVVGNGKQDVLLRAVGPTLGGIGVSGVLQNPKLQVFRGSTLILENDDWEKGSGNGTDSAEAAKRLGNSPLAIGGADAALVARLDPGVYTAHVSSSGAPATGIVLLEVYDASTAAGSATRVSALSTRGFVGVGDNTLIAGFVVSGDRPRKVLVRGIGPGMGGVAGRLSDPYLKLFKGSSVLAENDDWSSTANHDEVAAVAKATGASQLATGSKDAALLVTLEPGVYTAHISGVAGKTGVALAEVYEVP